MKTINKSLMILGLLFFALQGCTHDDYVPVPGPAGANGANGTNGIDGTTTCVACHSAAHRDPIIAAFGLSGHNVGIPIDGVIKKHVFGTNITFSDGSLDSDRAFCSQCHSQEGYIDAAKYGKPNPAGYNNVTSISCEGCHGQIHRSLASPTDDFGLRQIAATIQKINPAFTLNASPTGGTSTSNTCVTCHQIRPDSNGYYKRPVLESGEKDFAGAVVITGGTTPMYRFWNTRTLAKAMPGGYPAGTTNYKAYSNTGTGAHESPNADIWMGITGIDIEGTTTHLPAAKSAAHYKSNSCVSCHMDAPKTGTTDTGSHTLAISYVSCTKCHTSPEALLTTFHAEYDTKLENLRKALSLKTAYFNTSSSGSISIKFPTLPTLAKPTTNPSGSLDPTLWNLSTDVPLKYVQAYWNFKMLNGDFSKGVHNPLYVRALFQNSIEALQ